MKTEPLTGARYPESTDQVQPYQHIQNAVFDLSDNVIGGPFATTAARDTAYNAWVAAGNTLHDGMICYVTGFGYYERVNNAWIAGSPHRARGLVGYFLNPTDSAQFDTNTLTRIVGTINGQCNLITGRLYKAIFEYSARVQTAGAGVVAAVTGVQTSVGTPAVANSTNIIAQGSVGVFSTTANMANQATGIFMVGTSTSYSFSPWIRRAAVAPNTGWVQAMTQGTGINDNINLQIQDLGTYTYLQSTNVANLANIPTIA